MGRRAIKKESTAIVIYKKVLTGLRKTSEALGAWFKNLKRDRKKFPLKLEQSDTTSAGAYPRSKKYRSKQPKKSIGPRLAARRKRRGHFIRYTTALAVCLTVLLAFSALIGNIDFSRLFKEQSAAVKKPAKKPKPKSILFIGAGMEDGKEKAQGLALIIVKDDDSTISGWSIPDSTFIVVPGYGLDKISASLGSGIPTTIAAVKNFLGVEVNHYVRLSYEDYESTVSKLRLKKALERAEQTNLNQTQYKYFSKRFEETKPDDINLIPLPVKPLIVGRETYSEPDKDEIDHLFDLIWGISKSERESDMDIIILNGSGNPGVAGDVAEKLININCRIVQIENADNFDYDKTQIIIYKDKVNNTLANKIKKTLGTGVIVRQNVPQDLADVTIVVGKDYQIKKSNQ